MASNHPVIGIDLGTTYSAVAYLKGDSAEIIPDKSGRRTMPSVVAFTESGVATGGAAKKLELTRPGCVVKRIKRMMGTGERILQNKKEYSPEEVSSYLLKQLKEQAEDFLGSKIEDAIITVPAYFNDNQRQATKNAGKLAGLNVVRIINEPTAASLAYGIKPEGDSNIAVYDLGGGTFDVSVLNVSDGVFEVLSTAGDNQLGGEDFNRRLIDLVLERFKDETGLDLSKDALANVKIAEAVEKAKIELSDNEKARVTVPFVTADSSGPKNIDFELSRLELETLISDYIQRSIDLCAQALSDAGLTVNDINRVILVGGSSRIPLVRRKVEEHFKKAPDFSINPDEVVARGAALQGAIVSGDLSGIVLVDVNPISLGIEVENGYFVPIIERNSPIPTAAKRVFTTVADHQKSVDVHIMQGESMYSKNNISLGKFRLEGIRTAGKGEPRIEVTFEIDVNGILNVSAMDVDSKNMQGITIVEQGRISDAEILRLTEEHGRNYQEEIKNRQSFQSVLKLKTKADHIVSRIDNSISPAYQGVFLTEELDQIRHGLDKAVQDVDRAKLEKSVERLEFIMHELSAGSYGSKEMIA